VALHLGRSGQWRLSRRVVTGTQRDRCLSDRDFRLLPSQALVRLDGLYGNGTIVVDLIAAGVGFVMRGKDYALLDLTPVKQRLALPADEQFTHPESGTCRNLFDCGEVPVTGLEQFERHAIVCQCLFGRKGPQGMGGCTQGVIGATFPVVAPCKVKGQLGKLRELVHALFLATMLLKQTPDQAMKAAAAGRTDLGREALADFIMVEGEAALPVTMHEASVCRPQQMLLNHF
jgi:hypothetical protein